MTRHRQVPAGDATIHVAEAGPADGPAYLFVHGWPESWRTWQEVMTLAGRTNRALAIDLPGIGASRRETTGASKAAIAGVLRSLIETLRLADLTLVGHDIGGMVVYAYLREFADLPRAVIMDVPVPGVDPWDDFVREPFLWHFALHADPHLPELLTEGRHETYFGYFYDLLSAHPGVPSPASRAEQAGAYAQPAAMSTGFDWYRAFPADITHNQLAAGGTPVTTPLLYLRGSRERGGDIRRYAEGFRRAGIRHVESGLIAGSGHFPQEEDPAQTWSRIRTFANDGRGTALDERDAS
ncbi:MAG TPA: alpha/beta hydrolase [Trebonia sp.]|nr:alpha/beta hydrolase [Trebonia sp.]